MQAVISLPEVLSDENSPDIDKRIHVQHCIGGYAMLPHVILKRVFEELKGTRCMVFLYIWEKTISYRKLHVVIDIDEFDKNINCSKRSIINAISFLDRYRWITVDGDMWNTAKYNIHIDLLEETGCFITSYKAYLLSPHWKKLREETIKKAGNKCQSCNSDEHLEVHHISYDNLGHEKEEDLKVLCHNCHMKIHKEGVE